MGSIAIVRDGKLIHSGYTGPSERGDYTGRIIIFVSIVIFIIVVIVLLINDPKVCVCVGLGYNLSNFFLRDNCRFFFNNVVAVTTAFPTVDSRINSGSIYFA